MCTFSTSFSYGNISYGPFCFELDPVKSHNSTKMSSLRSSMALASPAKASPSCHWSVITHCLEHFPSLVSPDLFTFETPPTSAFYLLPHLPELLPRDSSPNTSKDLCVEDTQVYLPNHPLPWHSRLTSCSLPLRGEDISRQMYPKWSSRFLCFPLNHFCLHRWSTGFKKLKPKPLSHSAPLFGFPSLSASASFILLSERTQKSATSYLLLGSCQASP